MKYIITTSVILTLFSLTIIRIDLTYYDFTKNIVYDLEDDFHFFSVGDEKKDSCDVICITERWYPFPMINNPTLHGDMKYDYQNIFLNFIFYFLIWIIFNLGLVFLWRTDTKDNSDII